MNNLAQIIYTSMVQALMELRANKLRTFLSLLGITIGIFCIIAVFTTLDSMKKQIETQISSLGSDVLYVGRRPWMEEFKWWEFLRRPAMSTRELDAVHREVNNVEYATLFYSDYNFKLKYNDMEAEGVAGFAVTADFEKVQNIDVAEGRYLSQSEIDGGSNAVVIGSEVYEALFPPNADAVGKAISLRGMKFTVASVLTKAGQDAAARVQRRQTREGDRLDGPR